VPHAFRLHGKRAVFSFQIVVNCFCSGTAAARCSDSDTPALFAETAQRAAAPSIPSGHITVLVCTPVIYSRWFENGKKHRRQFLCATRRQRILSTGLSRREGELMRPFLWSLLAGALFVTVQVVLGQSKSRALETESVILRASVLGVKSEALPEASVIAVTVGLRLEVVNSGNDPVILLTERSPLCIGTTLTRTVGPAVGDNILFDEYRGPAVSTSPDWKVFRTTLDQPKPPVGIVQILKPGENWATESFVVLRPPIKLDRYRVDRPPVSWQILRDSSPVWLRLRCDLWPLNVERDPTSTKLSFGRELQTRWNGFGKLQLASLVTEPIELDLRERKAGGKRLK